MVTDRSFSVLSLSLSVHESQRNVLIDAFYNSILVDFCVLQINVALLIPELALLVYLLFFPKCTSKIFLLSNCSSFAVVLSMYT